MPTARRVIQSALRLLSITDESEAASAEQASDGLEVLNDMLHGLQPRGADLDFRDIALTDEVPLPREHIEACKFLLAARLAPEYGTQLTPEVAVEAQRAEQIFQAAYRSVPTLRPDRGLRDRLHRYGNRYNITSDT